jgi:hypothetical protein
MRMNLAGDDIIPTPLSPVMSALRRFSGASRQVAIRSIWRLAATKRAEL